MSVLLPLFQTLGDDLPPAHAEIAVPACIVPGRGTACPLDYLKHIVAEAIDSECVGKCISLFKLAKISVRCRHLITSATKRRFRAEAFETWRAAVGVSS
jgi:hypothetical protein